MSFPATSDGLPTFLPTLFPSSCFMYFHGAADNLMTSKVGQGSNFQLSSSIAPVSLTWSYLDYIYLGGGKLIYTGANIGDSATFALNAPATTLTMNMSNTGNATVQGTLIYPGNGAGNYDLNNFVPVPAPQGTNGKPTGLWDWSAPATGLGSMIPNPTMTGAYHLLTTATPLAVFALNIPLLNNGQADLTLPAVKAKQILPQWQFTVTLNASHTGLQLVWYLLAGRAKTV